ncbi:CtsR family transcriptional regulator [Halanaerobiaceae bacterium Z-7014]|uniref:Transcriptional regulator CtsR n=1 Tax=Halonatronomonas betaini TaxID=2778430 RepID=A0A931F9V5_9FIRM|nr:CtsR family transcriptional regulator [Halonatronomonas betaini]MBF8437983.1 CtsR family transcriptional regulator [Halonatronomonas betaini]
MGNLSDEIEKYLNDLINEYQGKIKIKRNRLADEFDCAPSQINYVLNTRFTSEKGYIVESRRGGSGFIRIIKISIESTDDLLRKLLARVDQPLTKKEAEGIIDRLYDNNIINDREKELMETVFHKKSLKVDKPLRNHLRGNLMKSMLEVILKSELD